MASSDRESRDVAKFLERSPRKQREGPGARRRDSNEGGGGVPVQAGTKLDLRRDLGLVRLEEEQQQHRSYSAKHHNAGDVYKWVNPESAAATGAYHSQQNSNSHSRQQQQQQQQQQDVGGGGGHLESKDLLHHPVYRELSRINGGINRMDLGELKRRCKELRLDCAGKREAVKRRLKEYHKRHLLVEAGLLRPTDHRNVDFLVVIDFEATCEERNPVDYQHEIIEFPAVLVDTRGGGEGEDNKPRVVDVFHEFCRPTINPVLSDFCRALTGIEQPVVDASDPFPLVHSRFLRWLEAKHRLGVGATFAVVTDGPFDMGRFLLMQTRQSGMDYPAEEYAGHWVNLRKAFANFYKGDFYANPRHQGGGGGGDASSSVQMSKLPGLQAMLNSLGMDFEGQLHCGLDDAKNIARVVVRMLEDGGCLRVNERIDVKVLENKDELYNNKSRTVTPVNRKGADAYLKAMRERVEKDSNSKGRRKSQEKEE